MKNITKYTPGFNIHDVQKKYQLKKVIKLASNENPFISDSVSKYISKKKHNINLYPDSKPLNLQALIAKQLGCRLKEKNIILGNGSNEILEFITRLTLNETSEVIIPKHSFLVYQIISKLQNAKIIVSKPDRNKSSKNYLGVDLDSIKKKISKKTKLIFIANPGNPTGTYIQLSMIEEFIDSIPKNIIVVIDEAYYEYLDPKIDKSAVSLITKYNNIIVTRSFSKIYGLASLRVGYGVSNSKIIDRIKLYKQPFNTNLFAQKAAELALHDTKFIEKSKKNNQNQLSMLVNLFNKLGINYLGVYCNFLTFEVGLKSDLLFKYLLKRGIILRPLTNYQLPKFLRVSLGAPNDMKKFSSAIKSFYNEKT